MDAKELDIDLNSRVTGVPDSVVLQRTVSHFRNIHSTAALEYCGHRVVNSHRSISVCGDKLMGTLELVRHRVPTPKTRLAFTEDAALRAMEELGFPVVLKPVVGSWGRFVSLLRDKDAARAVLEHREYMFPLYQVYYVQEYVKRPPRDIRSFVIGGRTVAAIYRISSPSSEDWRTNTARGGKAEGCKIGKELDELSLRAAEATDTDIAGVDLMETEAGLVVHEVNGTTEFKNTVPATGVDIPALIVDYLVSIQKK